MKKYLFLLFYMLFAQWSLAQDWDWVRSVTAFESEVYCCSSDNNGHFYVAGNAWGGPATFGAYTVDGPPYVVKYDSAGNVLWAIAATTSGSGGFLGISTDIYGNEYLVGIYTAPITFGGYYLDITSSYNEHYFISKVDSAGNVKWMKNIGNAYSRAGGTPYITESNSGAIYGMFPFTNNPTIGSIAITNASADSSTDLLIAKFDSSGTVIWASSYGGAGPEFSSGLSLTPTGNIYIDGYFSSDTFSLGTTTLINTGTAKTGFLALLDSGGSPVWANQIDSVQLNGLAPDATGNVFITGIYVNAQPTIGGSVLPRSPEYSAYGVIAKYSASGAAVWAKPMQGAAVIPWAPTIDPCGNVWVISAMGFGHMTTNDTIDGHILAPLPSNGEPDFIACWSDSGSFITAIAMPTGSIDDPNFIIADKCGNIYITAEQEDLDTLILGIDTVIHDYENIFFAKYNPSFSCGSCAGSTQVTITDADRLTDVYPNPATTTITISAKTLLRSIILTDLSGKKVCQSNCSGALQEINVNGIAPGMYLLTITAYDGRKETKKIVKE